MQPPPHAQVYECTRHRHVVDLHAVSVVLPLPLLLSTTFFPLILI